MVYLQCWHGWCHMKLLPYQHFLCAPYNHAPCHFMQSHICKVHACLVVTCHLHFWQKDRGLLHATAEHGGGTDTKMVLLLPLHLSFFLSFSPSSSPFSSSSPSFSLLLSSPFSLFLQQHLFYLSRGDPVG